MKWEPLRCQGYFIKISTHYTKPEVKFVAAGGSVNCEQAVVKYQ